MRRNFIRTIVALAAVGLFSAWLPGDAEARGGGKGHHHRKARKFLSAPPPSARSPQGPAQGGMWAGAAPAMPINIWFPWGGGQGQVVVADGGRAFVLDGFGNLDVVDTSGESGPALLGSVAVDGDPAALFVSDGVAVAVTGIGGSGWFPGPLAAASSPDAGPGARVTTVSLADPAHPAVLGTLDLAGTPLRTARFGTSLRCVTTEGSWGGPWMYPTAGGGGPGPLTAAGPGKAFYPWGGGGSSTSHAYAISLDDPSVPAVTGEAAIDGAATEAFLEAGRFVIETTPGLFWPLALGATDQPPTAARGSMRTARRKPADTFTGPTVVVATVGGDGSVAEAGSLEIPDLWSIGGSDLRGSVLRLLGPSASPDAIGSTLLTVDLSDPSLPAAVGRLDLDGYPYPFAFEGDTLFAVLQRSTGPILDPVPSVPWMGAGVGGPGMLPPDGGNGGGTQPGAGGWETDLAAFDLSDPAAPVEAGFLALDGGADGLRVRGGRAFLSSTIYVATGDGQSWTVTTGLTMVDVSVPSAMLVLQAEEISGSDYLRDFAGDLLLLDRYDYAGGAAGSFGLRLVDVSDPAAFAVGGSVVASAPVVRAVRDGDRLVTTTSSRLCVSDVRDPADPVLAGCVELAANVVDVAVAGDRLAALVQDPESHEVTLRVLPLDAPDARHPLAVLSLGTADDARLSPQPGALLVVTETSWQDGTTRFRVVDLSDPLHPAARGDLVHDGVPAGPVLARDGALFFLEYPADAWTDPSGPPEAMGAFGNGATVPANGTAGPGGGDGGIWVPPSLLLHAVDLSDADAPRLAGSVAVDYDFQAPPVLQGSRIYLSGYADWGNRGGDDYCTFTLEVVDASDLDALAVASKVPVPGAFLFAGPGDDEVVTIRYAWDDAGGETNQLCKLRIDGDRASVLDTLKLKDLVTASSRDGGYAYLSTEPWDWWDDGTAPKGGPVLRTVDLERFRQVDADDLDDAAFRAQAVSGFLFLRSYSYAGRVSVFDLAAPENPAPLVSVDSTGYGDTVVVSGDRAYLPAGFRGVESFAVR
jgi:hypothetical protein